MSDDFNARAGQKRLNTLYAAKQRAVADLAEYEAMDDADNAADTVGVIAELNRSIMNLAELAQQEHARINPPRQKPMTDQEFMALDAGRLKDNPALQNEVRNKILSKSKYFDPSKDWGDPNVQARVREGQDAYSANSPEFERQAKANGR